MGRLVIRLMGPPEVRHMAFPVSFETRKTLALLAILAAEGREHTRERLTALLRPESDGQRGPGSLRRTLAYLRDALGERDGPHLRATAGRLHLDPAADLELDLDLVHAALAQSPDHTR